MNSWPLLYNSYILKSFQTEVAIALQIVGFYSPGPLYKPLPKHLHGSLNPRTFNRKEPQEQVIHV